MSRHLSKAEAAQLLADAMAMVGAVRHHALVLSWVRRSGGVAEKVIPLEFVLQLCGEGTTSLALVDVDEIGDPGDVHLAVRRVSGEDPFERALGG